MIYDMIYLLTAIGLTPSGSNTVHMYTFGSLYKIMKDAWYKC